MHVLWNQAMYGSIEVVLLGIVVSCRVSAVFVVQPVHVNSAWAASEVRLVSCRSYFTLLRMEKLICRRKDYAGLEARKEDDALVMKMVSDTWTNEE